MKFCGIMLCIIIFWKSTLGIWCESLMGALWMFVIYVFCLQRNLILNMNWLKLDTESILRQSHWYLKSQLMHFMESNIYVSVCLANIFICNLIIALKHKWNQTLSSFTIQTLFHVHEQVTHNYQCIIQISLIRITSCSFGVLKLMLSILFKFVLWAINK